MRWRRVVCVSRGSWAALLRKNTISPPISRWSRRAVWNFAARMLAEQHWQMLSLWAEPTMVHMALLDPRGAETAVMMFLGLIVLLLVVRPLVRRIITPESNSAAALLARTRNPSDGEIEQAMSENLCRCGTYLRIKAGIRRAAQLGV